MHGLWQFASDANWAQRTVSLSGYTIQGENGVVAHLMCGDDWVISIFTATVAVDSASVVANGYSAGVIGDWGVADSYGDDAVNVRL